MKQSRKFIACAVWVVTICLVIISWAPAGAQQNTAVSTATPAPGATPGPWLYRITADEGFESWGGSGDWKILDGMLVNDGTNQTRGAYIAAPYQPSTLNYAIEAEIQFVRWEGAPSSFGIVSRADDSGAYWAGANYDYGAVIKSGDELLEHTNWKPDNDWHTFRLEVSGNHLRFLVDGTVLLETIDNKHLTPGLVGLWSDKAQISVRSFTVYSLDE